MHFDFTKKKRDIYWKYTLFYLLIAACFFGPYLITGHSLIWNTDAANQHLPLMVKYREYLLSFLRHLSQGPAEWSWTAGVGSDLFSIFSYYTIGDVFAYIALLFPTSHLVFAYQLILVLRLYCVGLAFVYFARHFSFKNWIILVGSGVYMVNAYLLYAAIAQPMFATTFMIFPIIVVQLEKVLTGQKSWGLLAVFVWMLVSNYYLAFVLGLGAILYLALRYGLVYYQKIDFWATFKKLLFAAVGAIALSAGLLIPELIAVLNSTRTGSEFANGLVFYPLYYYLLLPKQLINGDNWQLMFWSALGLASIILPALAYLFANWRKYRVIAAGLILGFIFTLIPAIGALFNGGMSPSNRWTLLLYLPLALTVTIFLKAVSEKAVTKKEWRTILLVCGIYLIYLVVLSFLENDYNLFLPVVFLFLSLAACLAYTQGFAPEKAISGVVVLNLAFNAVYAALPYNGSFASSMLAQGEYEQIAEKRYGGLNKILPTGSFYRVNTVSSNQFVSQKKLWNDLTSGLANVSSYYSIQNKYLGQFSTDLGNVQYDNNIPLHQLDDRTILNNFFGVRYIFSQKGSVNAAKTPGSYDLIGASKAVTDPDTATSYQARLYKTTEAFPLVWLTNKVISPSRYQKLSDSQKERALASGVVTSAKGNYQKAKLSGVKTVKASLVNNQGQKVNKNKINYTDSQETYTIKLSQKALAKLGKCELHVELSQVSYQPMTLSQQLDLELKKAKQQADLTGKAFNQTQTKYKYWRYHLLAGSPDPSYKISVSTNKTTETLAQPSQEMTSFFRLVDGGTLNLGSYQTLPSSLTLKPSKLGTYRLKWKVVAIPLNRAYVKEVRQIQQEGIKQLKLSQNRLSGMLNVKKSSIMTSTIPYSSGWHATLDGKAVKVIKTNEAFVGIQVRKGKHRLVLYYQTPGLRTGLIISILAAIILLACFYLELEKAKRAQKKR